MLEFVHVLYFSQLFAVEVGSKLISIDLVHDINAEVVMVEVVPFRSAFLLVLLLLKPVLFEEFRSEGYAFNFTAPNPPWSVIVIIDSA
jgi:hypothetical protein